MNLYPLTDLDGEGDSGKVLTGRGLWGTPHLPHALFWLLNLICNTKSQLLKQVFGMFGEFWWGFFLLRRYHLHKLMGCMDPTNPVLNNSGVIYSSLTVLSSVLARDIKNIQKTPHSFWLLIEWVLCGADTDSTPAVLWDCLCSATWLKIYQF